MATAAGYEELANEVTGVADAADGAGEKVKKFNKALNTGDAKQLASDVESTTTKVQGLNASMESIGGKFGLLADDVGDATEELGGFEGVAGSTIDTLTLAQEAFEAASRAAGNFGDELARLTGKAIGVADAEDALWETALGFNDALAAQDDELGHVNRSLDRHTLDGQANVDMYKAWRDNILSLAQARLQDGESIESVAADVLYNTGIMEENAVANDFSRQEFEDLLASWGMTPEMVETAIVQGGMLTAQEDMETLLAQYDDIPPEVATQIKALMDMGQYDAAKALLENFKVTRVANIFVQLQNYENVAQGIANLAQSRYVNIYAKPQFAEGGYIGSPVYGATIGEAGPEVVLPLTNPARMSSLLDDPRVSGPIMAAMDSWMPLSGWSGGGGGGDTYVNATINMPPGSNGDDVVRALRQYERRSGPIPISVR
jgi:hypothetical protein